MSLLVVVWLGARVALHLIDGVYLGTVEGIAGDGDIIVTLDDERGTVKLPEAMFEKE